jgi:hypothetical protein
MPLFKKWKTGDACELLPTLDAEQTARYRRFRRLLDHNRTALTLQADLEQIYYDNRPFVPQVVEKKSRQLLLEVDGMVHALSGMTGKDYEPLFGVLASIERSVQENGRGSHRTEPTTWCCRFEQIGLEADAGGRAPRPPIWPISSRELHLPTPTGFCCDHHGLPSVSPGNRVERGDR